VVIEGSTMRRKSLLGLMAIVLTALLAAPALAAGTDGDDTDTRMVDAKVVEVTPDHISVIARTGVEHVIAADDADTMVTREGKIVSLKDLRQGDTVTVELDAANPVKFAARINIAVRSASDVASATP
jgi:multidrug resistance efflux pump